MIVRAVTKETFDAVEDDTNLRMILRAVTGRLATRTEASPATRPSRKPSKFVESLATWAKRRREDTPRGDSDEEGTSKQECSPPQGRCADPQTSDEPEQRLSFRSSVLLDDPSIDIFLGDPVEGDTPLSYSCARVLAADADFALELRFQQDWFFQAKVFGALSTAIALAPGERTTLTIRNTQRKLFDQTTLDQTEKATETESTVSDKDVMNVARSSSRANNWSLSGQGTFGLGDFSVGASGSVSEALTNTASSSAERVRESTSKSSEQLKTLHKVEVRESVETTTETGRTRVIENPFRDRSLRIDIYELQKLFCVEFSLVTIAPCIRIDIRSLELDERFVRANGGFLADTMMDETLAAELAQALALTDQLSAFDERRIRAETLARLALSYLYEAFTVFGFSGSDNARLEAVRDPLGVGDPLPAGWNENDPSNSFRLPLAVWSGMQDAENNKATLVFTTLAVYRRLYLDRVTGPTGDSQLGLDLALSLESAIGPVWMASEGGEGDNGSPATNLNDWEQATEVFRRLAGFLAFVSGVVRPLVQPADEASEAASRRARFVIDRVVDHLICHRHYYSERFLWYMSERSHSRALTDFCRWVLEDRLDVGDPSVLGLFDPSAAYLEKSSVLIPLREKVPLEDLSGMVGTSEPVPTPGVLTRTMVTVPTDGWHIEPAMGKCILDDVPRPARPTPVPVAVELISDTRSPPP